MSGVPLLPAPPSRRDNAAGGRGPRTKRRKTAVACNECRDRKRRCDGSRPLCGACSKRSLPACVFDSEKGAKLRENEYTMALENKIRHMEHILASQSVSMSLSPNIGNAHCLLGINARVQDAVVSPEKPSGAGALSEMPSETIEMSEAAPQPLRRHDHPLSTLSAHATVQTIDSIIESAEASESDGEDQSESGVDPMGMLPATSSLSDSPGGMMTTNKGYFIGPSSTIRFMKHIQDAVKPRGDPNAQQGSRSSVEQNIIAKRAMDKDRGSTFPRGNYVVPPRHTADALVSNFWKHVHVLYPYLHRAAFHDRYRKLWSSSRENSTSATVSPISTYAEEDYYSNEPVFFCILNLVFALGCQHDHSIPTKERTLTGDIFYRRAQSFVNFDSLEHGDCALVQALLLMGLHLQSTDKTEKCWNVVGLAVRVAQSVGLYLNANSEGEGHSRAVDQTEQEVRKRVWAGCVLQDRVISLMSGRPMMLSTKSTSNLNYPSIIDDEELTRYPQMPGKQPQHKPSYMTFFYHATKLILIVGDILDAISLDSDWPKEDERRLNPESKLTQKARNGDFHAIIQLDATITRWYEELPWILKISSNAAAPGQLKHLTEWDSLSEQLRAIFTRQSKVLEVRFLHAKILLSRPVLAVLLSNAGVPAEKHTAANSFHTILQQSMVQRLSQHCVLAARDLTDLIYENVVSGDAALPAWWYNVFYLYTAATIFVAERLCPIAQQDSNSLRNEYWDKCLKGLRNYRSQSRSARKCYKVLELIDKRAFQGRDNGDDTSGTARSAPQVGAMATSHEASSQFPDSLPATGVVPAWTDPSHDFADVSGLDEYGMFNAQDMAWLANVPFDTSIDIDYPNADYFVDGLFPTGGT